MSRRTSQTRDVSLGETLNDAMRGEHGAMVKLEKLCSNHPSQSVVQQMMPILCHHLHCRAPYFDCHIERCPVLTKQEALASSSLTILARCVEQQETKFVNKALESLGYAQITDILHWMSHLFGNWSFNMRPRPVGKEKGPKPTEPHLMKREVGYILYDRVSYAVPYILREIAGNPRTRNLLEGRTIIGPLLAQIFFVSIRDERDDLMRCAATTYQRLVPIWDCMAMPFIQFLQIDSIAFAENIVSRIRQYSVSPVPRILLNNDLFRHLLCCTSADKGLLDACLEQEGIIRSLTVTLIDVLKHSETNQPTVINEEHKAAIMTILFISQFLKIGFERGGPSLIAVALDEGLLSAMLKLRKPLYSLWLSEVDEKAQSRAMLPQLDKVVAVLLHSIIPFTAYISVLEKSSKYLRKFQHDKLNVASREKTPELQQAFEALSSRLSDEFQILESCAPRAQDAPSHNINAYKFCDNVQCPFSENTTKLRRCARCMSAWYCSPLCQRAGWKSGHRTECEEIEASIRDGKEGFPPVMTSHELEYLRTSLIPRFHHLYEKLKGAPFTEETVFEMDLTTTPIKLTSTTREELGVDRDPGHFLYGLPGLVLTAIYPRAEKSISNLSLAGDPCSTSSSTMTCIHQDRHIALGQNACAIRVTHCGGVYKLHMPELRVPD